VDNSFKFSQIALEIKSKRHIYVKLKTYILDKVELTQALA